jgi:hypothetical protein
LVLFFKKEPAFFYAAFAAAACARGSFVRLTE